MNQIYRNGNIIETHVIKLSVNLLSKVSSLKWCNLFNPLEAFDLGINAKQFSQLNNYAVFMLLWMILSPSKTKDVVKDELSRWETFPAVHFICVFFNKSVNLLAWWNKSLRSYDFFFEVVWLWFSHWTCQCLFLCLCLSSSVSLCYKGVSSWARLWQSDTMAFVWISLWTCQGLSSCLSLRYKGVILVCEGAARLTMAFVWFSDDLVNVCLCVCACVPGCLCICACVRVCLCVTKV